MAGPRGLVFLPHEVRSGQSVAPVVIMSASLFQLLRYRRRLLCKAAISAVLAAGWCVPTAAQDVTAREVVQPLPSGEVQRLNRALMQLARDPRDLPALLEAGEASLAVDDFDAASGFFARAAAVESTNARALLGLAQVALKVGDGPLALDRFDKALAAGVPESVIMADRALGLDMVGDQAGAQAGYARALQLDPRNNEARRRFALSFAISGNRAGFEDTLRPLLDQRDVAALRIRAFGLAIFGDQERAAAIVEQVMPRDLSSRLIPYLAFMPRLTKPQQAAAANLGIFPRAADIGRDDPRLARFAREAEADSRLAPAGAPLDAAPANTRVASAAAAPSTPGVVPASARAARRAAAARDRAARQATPAPAPVPVATPAPAPTPVPTPAIATAFPSASPPAALPPVPQPTTTPPLPAPTLVAAPAALPPPPPAPAAPASLPPAAPLRVADAFADLGEALPEARVSASAVDITRIQPPREVVAKAEPKPEPKPAAKPKEPPKPVHPARHWVQIATGREIPALKFDWRRFEKQGGDAFKGLKPHTARWGAANRLLVGPLPNSDKARDLVKTLKAKGFDSFTYQSPEGEEVQVLK